MIIDVACGSDHALTVSTSTGSIYTWGSDGCVRGHHNFHQTSLPDLKPKVVISVSGGGGEEVTACVTKTGEVFTLGRRRYGKLGHGGHGDESNRDTPKRVESLIGVKAKQVSYGFNHTIVSCTEDGRIVLVYTFGKGEYHGQLVHDEDH